MFDQIMILAEGSTVFRGSFDDSVHFFEENGFPVPRFENPADFYLDIVNTKEENKPKEEAKSTQDEVSLGFSVEENDSNNKSSGMKKNEGYDRKQIVNHLVCFS